MTDDGSYSTPSFEVISEDYKGEWGQQELGT